MSIELIPDLIDYPYIVGAYREKKLVIFLGAGVSTLWGCKRWKEMGSCLINACYKRGIIDYWTQENLLLKYSDSPRKLITIAKSILKDDYWQELKETVDFLPAVKNKFPNLFQGLFSLEATFITTNIDSHFSSLFDKQNVHVNAKNFSSTLLKPSNIVHLHGRIDDFNSLVMTIDEYLDRYQNENFRDFLEAIFCDDKYCFLFVGYGADEMEIIDFMIQRFSKGNKSILNFLHRFYVLLPFFRSEESLYKYEQIYFNQIKMTIIPYAKDTNGFEQLNEVLLSWQKFLKADPDSDDFYKFNQLIERNL